MKKMMKVIMALLMLAGISFAIVNFCAPEIKASERPKVDGTVTDDGCVGEPLNC